MSIHEIFEGFHSQCPQMVERDTPGYTNNGIWTQKNINLSNSHIGFLLSNDLSDQQLLPPRPIHRVNISVTWKEARP